MNEVFDPVSKIGKLLAVVLPEVFKARFGHQFILGFLDLND
jgi:hypothetical protein